MMKKGGGVRAHSPSVLHDIDSFSVYYIYFKSALYHTTVFRFVIVSYPSSTFLLAIISNLLFSPDLFSVGTCNSASLATQSRYCGGKLNFVSGVSGL